MFNSFLFYTQSLPRINYNGLRDYGIVLERKSPRKTKNLNMTEAL